MNIHPQPSAPSVVPAEQDIQKCAYYLWREKGCPPGRDLELWLTAKELLRHRVTTPRAGSHKMCASMAKMRGATPGLFQ